MTKHDKIKINQPQYLNVHNIQLGMLGFFCRGRGRERILRKHEDIMMYSSY